MRELDGLTFSDVFVVLGTRNYLRDLRNNDMRIVSQVELAKKLEKPVFLLIDARLTAEEEKLLKDYFKEHNVLGETKFDGADPKSMENAVTNMTQVLKEKGFHGGEV